MDRVKFIKYKGEEILLVDYSDLNSEEVISLIEESSKLIKNQPQNSILELIDVTEMSFNQKVKEKLKEVAEEKAPYIKKSAVVGLEGLKNVVLKGIMRTSKREFVSFDSLAEAKDWLIKKK